MIIIKNIILYFIQIRHTDDLPSAGTGLVFLRHEDRLFSFRRFWCGWDLS